MHGHELKNRLILRGLGNEENLKNMYRNFHHFTTKTLDKKYVSAKGSVYKKTVVVSFYDTENHLITTEDYGEADLESVYAEIGKDKQITLDEAYIKNFSITAWRRLNIIDKKDIVDLNLFSEPVRIN